jgi:AcrR family transcriptional regulator
MSNPVEVQSMIDGNSNETLSTDTISYSFLFNERVPRKRLTKKAQETQRRILECALELFREKGFDKTSMRDIADAANVAVGASYYYFRTKEELVLAYYEDACSQDTEYVQDLVTRAAGFKERFSSFLRYKVTQLSENRGFMNIIARSAANPEDPLSPFGPQTKHIRDEAIGLMTMMMAESDLKYSEKFRPYLSGVLWFHMMGTIFLWIHDRSKNQYVSDKVIDFSVNLLTQLLWLSSLPLTGPINEIAIRLFDLILESQTVQPGTSFPDKPLTDDNVPNKNSVNAIGNN